MEHVRFCPRPVLTFFFAEHPAEADDGPADSSSIFNLSGPSDTEDSFVAHEVCPHSIPGHGLLSNLAQKRFHVVSHLERPCAGVALSVVTAVPRTKLLVVEVP